MLGSPETLAERIARVEAAVHALGEAVAGAVLAQDRGAVHSKPALPTPTLLSPLDIVQQTLRVRRARCEYLPPELFGEPGWDILLDLYVAQSKGAAVSVSSACIGADVPPTTALRWIDLMERRGMLVRSPDPRDRRRTYLRLTAAAATGLERLLARA